MATLNSVNVTKYAAGGSGDNIIPDGYIKTVEKVWLDTYVIAAAVPTTTSICIGKVPKNKKIVDIVVHLPVISGVATTSTVYCGTAASTSITPEFGTLYPLGTGAATINSATVSCVRCIVTGLIDPLAADTDIYIMINPATTITGGTIKSVIRYT